MAKNAHSTSTSTPSRRRTLFAGAAAVILGGGITAGAAASVADLMPVEPDTRQIALCTRYRFVRNELNSDPCITDEDLRWAAYFALCDEISDWHPTTIKGLIAKARITKEEANHPDGSEELEAQSMQWAWDVLNGLIGLGERAFA